MFWPRFLATSRLLKIGHVKVIDICLEKIFV